MSVANRLPGRAAVAAANSHPVSQQPCGFLGLVFSVDFRVSGAEFGGEEQTGRMGHIDAPSVIIVLFRCDDSDDRQPSEPLGRVEKESMASSLVRSFFLSFLSLLSSPLYVGNTTADGGLQMTSDDAKRSSSLSSSQARPSCYLYKSIDCNYIVLPLLPSNYYYMATYCCVHKRQKLRPSVPVVWSANPMSSLSL